VFAYLLCLGRFNLLNLPSAFQSCLARNPVAWCSSTTTCWFSSFSPIRHRPYTPKMRPQQDFSKSSCSSCCPPPLSCSLLVPLCLPSYYPFTFLVVFLCLLFPPLVGKALLLVACWSYFLWLLVTAVHKTRRSSVKKSSSYSLLPSIKALNFIPLPRFL